MGLHLKQSRHVCRQTENILVFSYIFCVETVSYTHLTLPTIA